MRKQAIYIIVITILVMTLSGFSCSRHQAMQTSAGIAASLKAMQDTEISLHNTGKVDDEEHRLLQQGFIFLAHADKDVRQCIYLSGAPTCVDAGINSVHNLLASPAVVGIKNHDSQQQMQLAGQALINSLNILKAAL
jgi:hypothetical protein